MKSHMRHMRKHRDTGGANEAEMDLDSKNMEYTKDANVNREATEKKRGGRAKRAHGGKMMGYGHPAEKKMVGNISGPYPKPNAGRKPRKQGGGTYSDSNPFTSARKGTPAPGRKLEMEME